MSQALSALDWWIIGLYLLGLVLFSLYLSRSQHSREDYYVGGHVVGPWLFFIAGLGLIDHAHPADHRNCMRKH